MDIIIIGAGASGIVTAINAKNENNRVILLEKNDRIGKIVGNWQWQVQLYQHELVRKKLFFS